MASTTTTARLDQWQARTLDRAREILAAQDYGSDPHSLGYRIGQLEHDLDALIRLVDQLTR